MKLVIFFADGFAWQYVKDRPFMDDFWGERRPLETLLGYSSTIMPAIVTGRQPRETGIWTEYYFAPEPRTSLQKFFSRPRVAPLRPLVDLWRLVWFRITRKVGYSAEHRLRLPLDVSHLFSRHPIRYDEFPPIALPVPTLADEFSKRGLTYDFSYISDGLQADRELERLAARRDEVDIFFFYDPSLDGGGHEAGADAEALATPIDEIERFLRGAHELLAEAGDDPEILLFSDHGMTNVDETFDLFARLEDYELGRDYVVFMDSTFARFWFPDAERRKAILDAISDAPGTLLTDADRERYGIDFPDRSEYGEEVLVADEGVVFHPNYFAPRSLQGKGYPERAMHGYLPEAPSTDGVFFYRGERLADAPPERVPVTEIFGYVMSILDASPAAGRKGPGS